MEIKVSFPYLYSMEKALENLSKEDLLTVISSRDEALLEEQQIVNSLTQDSAHKDEKIDYLESQLAMYKRMQFGRAFYGRSCPDQASF